MTAVIDGDELFVFEFSNVLIDLVIADIVFARRSARKFEISGAKYFVKAVFIIRAVILDLRSMP